ncbi:abortive infection family protein [Lutibacter sp. A80]|uniref:abortive infection family protein n=1 Tax=Lutibacter sp. A80 TaxID=2918453 RepID=UPI001F0576B5|nr:abortive infection family protein [Lutibacter sp. A80]UMB59898.1 abortive infection family protein [Lutibacter sp. A80]
MKIISPKYKMQLVPKVFEAIKCEWDNSYTDMEIYLRHWHVVYPENVDGIEENFYFQNNEFDSIDFKRTLHSMPDDILLKIAIEMGVDTPGFIPSFPTFKNELKSHYYTAYESFEKAVKSIEEDPDLAVGMANSTLESIVKHILEDKAFNSKPKGGLETLMKAILKEFSMSSNGKEKEITEINKIASSLINVSQNIEGLRSNKTTLHGKTKDDYVLNDSLYAYFIVNSVTTVGMFLKDFYETKYKVNIVEEEPDDLPF